MSQSRKRWLLGTLPLVVLTVCFVMLTPAIGSAGTAAAQAANACGVEGFDVPDSQSGLFDFTAACGDHDICYTNGGSELDRYACDQAFLMAMKASCDQMWSGGGWAVLRQRWRCYGVAYTYYFAVRAAGWAFFNYEGTHT